MGNISAISLTVELFPIENTYPAMTASTDARGNNVFDWD